MWDCWFILTFSHWSLSKTIFLETRFVFGYKDMSDNSIICVRAVLMVSWPIFTRAYLRLHGYCPTKGYSRSRDRWVLFLVQTDRFSYLLIEYMITMTTANKTTPITIWNLKFCHQNFLLIFLELILNSFARLDNSSLLSFNVSIRSPRSNTLFMLDCITLVSWFTSFCNSFILLPPGSCCWFSAFW